MNALNAERFKAGERAIRAMGPYGERLIDNLKDIAPDFADYIIEFGFGSILSRPGLDLRERELATIAVLVAVGYAPRQLKAHIEAALNVGATRGEVVEVIMQTCLYAGIPAALNGLALAKEVFAERDLV
jgi:4-carboxymuconolactone decarboxylase